VRERHPNRYTIVGNHLTQHRELSLTAIGLAAHIQSLPDGAPVDIRTLAERFPEGRDRIAAALRELEAYGYLERVRERTPDGRVVTRTYAYNHPEATRTRRAARETQPVQPVKPVRPVRPVRETHPVQPVREPHPVQPVREPERVRPVREPQPEPAAPECTHPAAAALLASLRRDDDRLLLSERDVHRLAPAVAAWLERGAAPDAVRRTLTANLPPDLRHPAAFLAHRLTALLPPPLPAAPAPSPRPAVVPLRNCNGCDRAFRSPAPGARCRDCRQTAAPVAA